MEAIICCGSVFSFFSLLKKKTQINDINILLYAICMDILRMAALSYATNDDDDVGRWRARPCAAIEPKGH